ncbi:hypothetical protein E5D57_011732 [Metarhizium anisopliae]|uniref:BZIP domain-containing protein n=1 Tax=Metarhizium robertsii TaxID=568076 RepID=A0A0A1V607_9HYPO|nr:hypothetical protein X797_002644 [Metarhizium robertsii]KAF5123814.1 hypothetical protein E5D57_011732 [Metarhizium anisopliae]
MTTPAHKANLARIRDNQRRSRARRREYLQELEQRLRVCELQGIEASAEVQMAARRVADENTQLRELLNRYGVTNEYITHYLQASTENSCESGRAQPIRLREEAGVAMQSLSQAMLPRRAAHLEQTQQFAIPSQSSREDSIASASTTNSSVWEPSQPSVSYNHHPQQLAGVSPTDHPHYSPSAFSAQPAITQSDQFQSASGQMVNDSRHDLVRGQPMPIDNRLTMNYQFSMSPYNDPTNRYGPQGGPF